MMAMLRICMTMLLPGAIQGGRFDSKPCKITGDCGGMYYSGRAKRVSGNPPKRSGCRLARVACQTLRRAARGDSVHPSNRLRRNALGCKASARSSLEHFLRLAQYHERSRKEG